MNNIRDDEVYHAPVMVECVLEHLITDPSGVYVDGTLGGGGHAEAILQHLDEDGKLIGMDRDEEALVWSRDRLSRYGNRIEILHEAFGHVAETLEGQWIDGFFLDLGVSSHQLDTPERGFSYQSEGPLDCRMDTMIRHDAKYIVNTFSAESLADVLYIYGEERASRRIARAVVEERIRSSIETTTDLARVVRRAIPAKWQNKSLSRVFQGLRIFVNQEMEQLQSALLGAYNLLKPGGRMVILSYHSLEDRMVKRFFRGETPTFRSDDEGQRLMDFNLRSITKRAVRPSDDEVSQNSRSRSAKLRAAEKTLLRQGNGMKRMGI